ncbi:MAG: hypothetical protein AABY93_18885 [Bacteroidota bacterium]
MEENKFPDKIDTLNSILMFSQHNHVILQTCLDVLIAIHLDGKTEEEKDKFLKRINEKISAHREDSKSNFFPANS